MFFFEKKNRKTFIHYSFIAGRQRAPRPDKSLFASFSSEKEDLPSPSSLPPPRTGSQRPGIV
jgi:hypothetical protein